MDSVASLPLLLELAIVLKKYLPSGIGESYADRWAALRLQLELPVFWWPLLLFLCVHFFVVVGVRSAIILNVDPAFARQSNCQPSRQPAWRITYQSFLGASQGVELGQAPARNISLGCQPPGPALHSGTGLDQGIALGSLTVRPFSDFSRAEPLVPTFPKTLLSSTACILEILLPTRCWRRKCTHLATRSIRLAVCPIAGDYVTRSDLHTFCDFRHGGGFSPVVWSSEPIYAYGRVTRFRRGVVMQ